MDLNKIELGRIQIEATESSNAGSSEEPDPSGDQGGRETGIRTIANLDHSELAPAVEEESCRTPRSEENRIPEATGPPPPPRKKRRQAQGCTGKLKAAELEFFETVNGEQVEELFRSGFEFATRQQAKRSKSVV